MRLRPRLLALPPIALAILAISASGKELRTPLGRDPILHATSVPLAPGDARRVTVGRLRYLGGVRLTSPDLGFSGFSALSVVGDRFTLLSDRGNLVRFRMGSDWRPSEIRFDDLPAGPGTSAYKGDRDSESMTRDPVSGLIWVGFESHNAIFRYNADFSKGLGVERPKAMVRWPQNGGPESMVRLPDGRFLVIGETARPLGGQRDQREVLLFPHDPTIGHPEPVRLAYVPPAHYDPSDAALLPDGRLLVLVRRFAIPSLFTVKIELVDIRGAKPGQVLRGIEIADFSAPLQHDNFEGLAVQREGDSLVLWMISDDNEQWWQQTLLLKFRLDL
ncbi:esterase-like activity of phytase family protein [Sphingomonas sp. R1]|uniref:esterase-like activity of phytase family protein n=1 Tax=Sphingomonas sp. R1 TaxID=399176 RepID=UPI0022247366|nr:esterase-like activity of phytase family protein [Sphingomonas sp. R1]UYY76712.1 esterase-like activity of phytase family protein [Sphingomonas sp. R1]